MKIYEEEQLLDYLKDDYLLSLLQASSATVGGRFISHKWLIDSPVKRLVYHDLYGDLLADDAPRKSILDIGGGCSSLTEMLVAKHDYELLDLNAHDSNDLKGEIESCYGKNFWISDDWYEHQTDKIYDIVIANDLFPNVDQRLGVFLHKYLPLAKEVRLLVTFYNSPRWYPVKRLNCDEIMCLLAWDGRQLLNALEQFRSCLCGDIDDRATFITSSLYPNGRQIASLTLKSQ